MIVDRLSDGPRRSEAAAMSEPQHIHAMFFVPVLDYAHQTMEPEQVAAVLQSLDLTEAELRDPRAWWSCETTDRLCEAFVEASGNPDFLSEVGRIVMTGPSTRGFLGPLFRVFGSPHGMLAQLPTFSSHFCKSGHYEVETVEPGFARLSFVSELEGSEHVCVGRTSQLRWVFPGVFGLPPAEVEHPECMHRGGTRCTYELRWDPPRDRMQWMLPVGAATLGLIGALLSGIGAIGSVVCVAAGGTMGGLLAWALALDRALGERADALLDAKLALQRGLDAEEARYRELLEAKQDVDRQVEEALAEIRSLDVLATVPNAFSDPDDIDLPEVLELPGPGPDAPLVVLAEDEPDLRRYVSQVLAAHYRVVVCRDGQQALLEAQQRLPAVVVTDASIHVTKPFPLPELLDRIERLPHDLLNLAEERERPPGETHRPSEGLAEALRLARARAPRGVRFVIEIEALGRVEGRKGDLDQVFVSLIDHAVRAVGFEGTVVVSATAVGEAFVVAVSHSGAPLTEAVRERITALQAPERGPDLGPGRGLAMAAHVIRSHRGTFSIEVDPELSGDRFAITLPLVLEPVAA